MSFPFRPHRELAAERAAMLEDPNYHRLREALRAPTPEEEEEERQREQEERIRAYQEAIREREPEPDPEPDRPSRAARGLDPGGNQILREALQQPFEPTFDPRRAVPTTSDFEQPGTRTRSIQRNVLSDSEASLRQRQENTARGTRMSDEDVAAQVAFERRKDEVGITGQAINTGMNVGKGAAQFFPAMTRSMAAGADMMGNAARVGLPFGGDQVEAGYDWVEDRLMDGAESLDAGIEAIDQTDPLLDRGHPAKMGQAVGSSIPFLLGGWASGGSRAAIAALGMAQNVGSEYEVANALRESGEADDNDVMFGMGLQAIVGASEAIPIANAFARANRRTGGALKRYVADIYKEGGEEFVQEFLSTILSNAAAKVSYEPGREVSMGEAMQSAVYGFFTGGLTGAVVSAPGAIAEGRRGPRFDTTTDDGEAVPTEILTEEPGGTAPSPQAAENPYAGGTQTAERARARGLADALVEGAPLGPGAPPAPAAAAAAAPAAPAAPIDPAAAPQDPEEAVAPPPASSTSIFEDLAVEDPTLEEIDEGTGTPADPTDTTAPAEPAPAEPAAGSPAPRLTEEEAEQILRIEELVASPYAPLSAEEGATLVAKIEDAAREREVAEGEAIAAKEAEEVASLVAEIDPEGELGIGNVETQLSDSPDSADSPVQENSPQQENSAQEVESREVSVGRAGEQETTTLSGETLAEWDAAEAAYKAEREKIKSGPGNKQEINSRLRGAGKRHAAEKRRISGLLTEREQRAADKKAAAAQKKADAEAKARESEPTTDDTQPDVTQNDVSEPLVEDAVAETTPADVMPVLPFEDGAGDPFVEQEGADLADPSRPVAEPDVRFTGQGATLGEVEAQTSPSAMRRLMTAWGWDNALEMLNSVNIQITGESATTANPNLASTKKLVQEAAERDIDFDFPRNPNSEDGTWSDYTDIPYDALAAYSAARSQYGPRSGRVAAAREGAAAKPDGFRWSRNSAESKRARRAARRKGRPTVKRRIPPRARAVSAAQGSRIKKALDSLAVLKDTRYVADYRGLPEYVQREYLDAVASGDPVPGYFDSSTGTAYVIGTGLVQAARASDVSVETMAIEVGFHETVAHRGLRYLFGSDEAYNTWAAKLYNKLGLDRVRRILGPDFNAYIDQALELNPDNKGLRDEKTGVFSNSARLDDAGKALMADEVMAAVAEKLRVRNGAVGAGTWERIRAALGSVIRRVTGKNKATDTQIRELLYATADFIISQPSARRSGDPIVSTTVPTPRYMMAGIFARTPNDEKREEAERMYDRRVDTEEIRQKTGWHQGADGRMRFEIDDSAAELTPAFGQLEVFGEKDLVYDADMISLEDALDHPELFAAYPGLRSVMVGVKEALGDIQKTAGGWFDHGQNRIFITPYSPVDPKRVMLHEVQHWIQDYEGFASGGSPRDRTLANAPTPKALIDHLHNTLVSRAAGWVEQGRQALKAADEASDIAEVLRDIDTRNLQARIGEFKTANQVARADIDSVEAAEARADAERAALVEYNQVAERIAATLEVLPSTITRSFGPFDFVDVLYSGVDGYIQRVEEDVRLAKEYATDANRFYWRVSTETAEADLRATVGEFMGSELYQALAGEIEARDTEARIELPATSKAFQVIYEGQTLSGEQLPPILLDERETLEEAEAIVGALTERERRGVSIRPTPSRETVPPLTGNPIPVNQWIFRYNGGTSFEASPAPEKARPVRFARMNRAAIDDWATEVQEEGGTLEDAIWNLNSWDLDEMVPEESLWSVFFGPVNEFKGVVYHRTHADPQQIADEGLYASNKTRGINNRGVGNAVFAAAQDDEMGSYGPVSVAINVGALRSVDEDIEVSLEPSVVEALQREAIADAVGLDPGMYSGDTTSGETEDTLILYADVAPEFIEVTDEDGDVVHTGSRFSRKAPATGGPLGPSEEVRAVAQGYATSEAAIAAGVDYTPWQGYAPINVALSRATADYYQDFEHAPDAPEVQAAYRAFADETRAQWDYITATGMKFLPWLEEGQPYATSAEMVADVRDNKRLYFFLTEGGFGETEAEAGNPLLEDTGIEVTGKKLVVNDLFRAVHDYFGHAEEGHQFGPRGEYNAALVHAVMFSETARGAMLLETHGQNSWVNFGQHLRRDDESLPKKGEPDWVHPADRPYADQKSGVLPRELWPRFARGRGAQISAETVPARASGKLQAIYDAPYEVREAFTQAVWAEVGPQALALAGIQPESVSFRPGFWDGDRNPSIQIEMPLGQDEGVALAADILGYVLEQDAVGTTVLTKAEAPEDVDALEIEPEGDGAPLTADEINALYEMVGEATGNPDSIAFVATQAGVRVLDYGRSDGESPFSGAEEFVKVVTEAAESLREEDLYIGGARNLGQLRSNDYETDTDGQAYQIRIDAGGSPGLLKAANTLRSRASEVAEDFARAQGWNQRAQPRPRYARGRRDVGDRRLDGAPNPSAQPGMAAADNPRVAMSNREVTERIDELTEAAQQVMAGEMSAEEYDVLVNAFKPISPYEFVPEPPSIDEMGSALRKNQIPLIGVADEVFEDGDAVQMRLDIPAYKNHDTWIVSLHTPRSGPNARSRFRAVSASAYEQTAVATDVEFGMYPEDFALRYASGRADKATFATMLGAFKAEAAEEAFARAEAALSDPEWIQVGMDPERHSYFYDRATTEPVIKADEVIQIGPLVVARNPVYAPKSDFRFARRSAPRNRRERRESEVYTSKPLPAAIEVFQDMMPPDGSTVGIRTGAEELPMDDTTIYDGRVALHRRWKELNPGKSASWKKADIDRIADALTHEALYELTRDGNALGWYAAKTQEALNKMAQIFPEIATDENARSAFIYALAFTSNGTDVYANFENAEELYAGFRETGRFDTTFEWGGKQRPTMRKHAELYNRLLRELGPERLRAFLIQRMTNRELKERGFGISSELIDSEGFRGASMLGSKLGSFYANLYGFFESVTMDLWLSRTIARQTGEILPAKPELLTKWLGEMRALMARGNARLDGFDAQTMLAEMEAWETAPTERQEDPLFAPAVLPTVLEWAKGRRAEYARGRYKDKATDNPVAKNIYEKVYPPSDTPGSGTRRNWIREVFAGVQERLADHGIQIEAADLQAVLWYYEKNLYSQLGIGNEVGEPADYAQAASYRLEAFQEREAEPAPGSRDGNAGDRAPGSGGGLAANDERTDGRRGEEYLGVDETPGIGRAAVAPPGSRFARKRASNREWVQDSIELWSKNTYSSVKRAFTGDLPPALREEALAGEGRSAEALRQMNMTINRYQKAAKEEYGRAGPDTAESEVLDGALRGVVSIMDAPKRMRAPLTEMRRQMAILTSAASRKGLLSSTPGIGIGPGGAVLIERIYKSEVDPSWHKVVPKRIRNRAEKFLRDAFPTFSEPQIQKYIGDLLHGNEDGTFIRDLASRPATDWSLVDPEDRPQLPGLLPGPLASLAGEIADPRATYVQSVQRLMEKVSLRRTALDLRRAGMGVYFFEPDPSVPGAGVPEGFTKRMDFQGDLKVLDGLYTTPEIAEGIKRMSPNPGAQGDNRVHNYLFRKYFQAVAATKSAKTIYSWLTTMVNYSSGIFLLMRLGHLATNRYTTMSHVLAFKHGFGLELTAEEEQIVSTLVRANVMDSNIRAGDIAGLIKDAGMRDDLKAGLSAGGEKATLAVRQLLEIAPTVYQGLDNIYKIQAYLLERDQYREAKPAWTDTEVDAVVTKIVRDGIPNYNMISEAIQGLRRAPVAPFVSFWHEVIRTEGKNWQRLQDEFADPDLRGIAGKRLSGMLSAHLWWMAASMASAFIYGIDWEEDRALRQSVAPWERSSAFVYWDNPGGEVRMFSLNRIDPLAMIHSPLVAMVQGPRSIKERVKQAGMVLIEPVAGPDILAGALAEAATGKKISGGKIHDGLDDAAGWKRAGAHVGDSFMPTFPRQWTKYINMMAESEGGREYLANSFGMLVGQLPMEVDIRDSLGRNAGSVKWELRNATGELTTTLTANPDEKMSESDIKRAAEHFVRRRRRAYVVGREYVDSAMQWGVSNEEARSIVEADNLHTDRDTDAIMAGTYADYSPTRLLRNDITQSGQSQERVDELTRRKDLAAEAIYQAEEPLMQD